MILRRTCELHSNNYTQYIKDNIYLISIKDLENYKEYLMFLEINEIMRY